MRRSPDAIRRRNAAVVAARAASVEHRKPDGTQVLLENIFDLDEGAVDDIAPDGHCPFLGQEAWVSAEGRFDPCCAPDEQRRTLGELGTLTETSIHDVWSSEGYRELLGSSRNRALCMGIQHAQARGEIMTARWEGSRVSSDETHHVSRGGSPLYAARFRHLMKFHAPGLAPALDDSGAHHIDKSGTAAYDARYIRTFGFYEERAAVEAHDGWTHVDPSGRPISSTRCAWAARARACVLGSRRLPQGPRACARSRRMASRRSRGARDLRAEVRGRRAVLQRAGARRDDRW
jgi:Iron-sulfur cluster-binding domain